MRPLVTAEIALGMKLVRVQKLEKHLVFHMKLSTCACEELGVPQRKLGRAVAVPAKYL